MIEEMYIRGVEVNYYFVCKTKLWLFSHNVNFERESDLVKLGKLVHREFYQRDKKDVQIGPIAIDVIRKGDKLEIQEVKKAKSMKKPTFSRCSTISSTSQTLEYQPRAELRIRKAGKL